MANEQEIKSVTKKIKALLAKTIESGATEAEAMSAFTKAHEMLSAYQLNLSDLDIREEGTNKVEMEMDLIIRRLFTKVAKYCDCKGWMSEPKVDRKTKETLWSKVSFLGIKTDADFAEWLITALASYVQGKQMAFLFHPDNHSSRDTDDFVTGCIDRINERLQYEIDKRNAQKASYGGRDLVPLKSAMINEAFNRLNMRMITAKSVQLSVNNSSAYLSGRKTGDGVTFNRPVSDNRDFQKLLK